MTRRSRWGYPLGVTPQSSRSMLLVEPTGGVNFTQPVSDLPLGQSGSASNFIVRQGFLEKRAMLVSRATQGTVPGVPCLGGIEAVDVLGNVYPFASFTTRPQWYSVGSWSFASYVSANGLNDAPSNSSTSYWDLTQIYYDTRDENVVVMGSQSYQSLYVWESNTTVFSSLTGAPRARYVAAQDNYLLAANIRDGSNDFVQRIQWSDRGSIATWTGGLAGFQDLLDMKGAITRLVPQDNVVLAFGEQEVWAGRQGNPVQAFDFVPLDRSVGAPYPWTIESTRVGVMWLGKDWNVYLLAKGEIQARRIGDAVQRELQRTLDAPERSWAVYNRYTDQYELWYPVRGGSGRPQRALFFDLGTGSWMPQTLDDTLDLTRGWQGTLGTGSGATTWAQAKAAGIKWSQAVGSWGAQKGQATSGDLAVYAGTSAGTMFYFSPSATSDSNLTVEARWRSGALHGGEPYRSKTLLEVRVDYQADSASSLTVRASANQGESFEPGEAVALPTSSTESQQVAYPYLNSRYPVVELASSVGRPKLARLWATLRIGGR